MIIAQYDYADFRVLVHGPDVCMPDAAPFATVYIESVFTHQSQWPETIKPLVAQCILEAVEHPHQFPKDLLLKG